MNAEKGKWNWASGSSSAPQNHQKPPSEGFEGDPPSGIAVQQPEPEGIDHKSTMSKDLCTFQEPQLLDKEGLAAKLLECAEEKVVRSGQVHYANDAKDRLGFLRLYAEVMGFAGKAIDASINNFTNNEMRVVLVKPKAEQKIRASEADADKVEEATNVTPLRIKVV